MVARDHQKENSVKLKIVQWSFRNEAKSTIKQQDFEKNQSGIKVLLGKLMQIDADIIGMSEIDSLSGGNTDLYREFV